MCKTTYHKDEQHFQNFHWKFALQYVCLFFFLNLAVYWRWWCFSLFTTTRELSVSSLFDFKFLFIYLRASIYANCELSERIRHAILPISLSIHFYKQKVHFLTLQAFTYFAKISKQQFNQSLYNFIWETNAPWKTVLSFIWNFHRQLLAFKCQINLWLFIDIHFLKKLPFQYWYAFLD